MGNLGWLKCKIPYTREWYMRYPQLLYFKLLIYKNFHLRDYFLPICPFPNHTYRYLESSPYFTEIMFYMDAPKMRQCARITSLFTTFIITILLSLPWGRGEEDKIKKVKLYLRGIFWRIGAFLAHPLQFTFNSYTLLLLYYTIEKSIIWYSTFHYRGR
jgi:hypothetical protein